ncbi:MAG: VCBS repeat-containing protein, partial [Candidatus Krumholzibacteria bacterium]|nr:VCBS repeat-containing protein [Candidatus Krumholzibacteria bacterium]
NLPVTLGTITDEGDTVFVAATGVLPPSLSAWCKWYLGWLEMGEVSTPVPGKDEYLLPAVGVPREQYWRYNAGFGNFDLRYPQAYRAGASPREYFLIENRWVPLTVAQTPFSDLRFERDEATGVVQYLAGLYEGTWENSGLYDFFMPAGGLLVWHVNADRIATELGTNTINAYGDGLRLVEGDGIQDIGVLDAFVLGWFGSWRDPFGGVDPDGVETGYADLYREQFPSSRNYDRSFSGLRLSEMGPRVARTAAVMKFQATIDPVLEGFPWEVAAVDSVEAGRSGGSAGPRSIEPSSLTPLTVGGEQLLVFSDKSGPEWDGDSFSSSLYALRPNGQPRWVVSPTWPEGVFQVLGGTQVGSPLALDHAVDGKDLIWATNNGRVGATQLTGVQSLPRWVKVISDSLVTGPMPLRWQGAETRIMVGAYPDSVYLLDTNGALLGEGLQLAATPGFPVADMEFSILPFAGASAEASSDLAAAFTEQGWYLLGQDATGLQTDYTFTAYAEGLSGTPDWVVSKPLSADEVAVTAFAASGPLGTWSVSADGTVRSLDTSLNLDGPLVCAPAVADVDGDGRHDMVLATATRIYGYKDDGVALRGFPVKFYDLYPLADSTRVQGPLVVADATGDGINDVFFNTTGGHLLGLNATGQLLNELPLRWGDSQMSGMAVGGTAVDRILWLVSSGGYTDGFLDRIAINGRVNAYGLLPVAADEDRTSEWLGPNGGVARSGPVGQARDLGTSAPASAEKEQVYLYPNPLSADDVKVRFYSQGTRAARLAIYNLEGELVARQEAPVTAGAVNEIVMPLPGIASGLYLARLEFEGTGGLTVRTMTLAVEK